MKTSIQVRNGVSSQMLDSVVRLVDLIPWPIWRSAMGDVTTSLLDGKPRVPGGILEIVSGRSFLFFTSSYKTSDFMVDGLLLWWNERKRELPDLKCIVINMDNGPECSGRRSQFLKRIVEFSDITRLPESKNLTA